jgi:hypothetical protein
MDSRISILQELEEVIDAWDRFQCPLSSESSRPSAHYWLIEKLFEDLKPSHGTFSSSLNLVATDLISK